MNFINLLEKKIEVMAGLKTIVFLFLILAGS